MFFYQSTVFEGNNKIAKGASVSGAFVDRNTYLGTDSDFHNCKIGRFCSIASNIKVIAETHPSSVFVSTPPSFFSILMQNGQSFVKK